MNSAAISENARLLDLNNRTTGQYGRQFVQCRPFVLDCWTGRKTTFDASTSSLQLDQLFCDIHIEIQLWKTVCHNILNTICAAGTVDKDRLLAVALGLPASFKVQPARHVEGIDTGHSECRANIRQFAILAAFLL